MRDSFPCERARVLFMLSEALRTSNVPEDVERAETYRTQAKSIYCDLSGNKLADTDVREEVFDCLVERQLR